MFMNLKKLIAALCIAGGLITAGFINYDNDYPIEKIVQQLNTWAANYTYEKVYLQFDKPYYAVGDDMWFKAYVTLGPEHKLSGLSGVLNVELIDERDSVVQRIKLPVVSGLTWGDFALNDTLHEGNYRVRAYTNWMRNAGEDYFFDKHISIVNAVSNKVFTKTNYTISTENGQQKVNALINYTDFDGKPYANKEVRYTVGAGDKTLAKGKGLTDDKGNLTIAFVNNPTNPLSGGVITTSLKLDDKSIVTKTIPVKTVSANIDVQFFPEGGYLVNDVTSKVAFKAVSADGLGADIKGTITDDANTVLATFNSKHLGMGVFNLMPITGKSYKANIVFADGSSKSYDLPQAIDKGYVLAIDNSDTDKVHLKISTSRPMLLVSQDDTLSLIAQAGGVIYYAAKSRPGIAVFTADIPKSKFPSGIIQFTLISAKQGALNERLVFIQNPDQLKLDVNTDKQSYSPGQKVSIKLNAKNGDDKPVQGSFSVAVVDETKVPVKEEDESTILSNLLLTSDLKGYVEKPNYYFTNVNEQTRADLDLLMLTQGYSRFEWKDVLSNNFPAVTYHPEKTLEIEGHITKMGGKPLANAKVTLAATKGGLFFLDTVTDAQGKFKFDNLAFNDSLRFVIQARTEKNGKYVKIVIDNMAPQKISSNKNAPDFKLNVDEGLTTYLQSSKTLYTEQLKYGLATNTIVLKEVEINDTRQQKQVKNSTNLNGPGNADQVLTSDKIPPGCIQFGQCLTGVLTFISFDRNGVPYSRGAKMSVCLDGVFLPDDEIADINMNDIASIEVLRTIGYFAIYGYHAGGGGVIVLTSKSGEDMENERLSEPAPGIIVYSPLGYHKIRTFYSPQYDDPKTNIPVANLRSTIYWNPNMITDKDGNTSFQYFNAGSKGTYRVIIEGIDNDGNIGRRVFRYKVD